jgi:hypothetical protein
MRIYLISVARRVLPWVRAAYEATQCACPHAARSILTFLILGEKLCNSVMQLVSGTA